MVRHSQVIIPKLVAPIHHRLVRKTRSIGLAEAIPHVVLAAPSGAVEIVGFPLLGVGEDVVRRDDESVALYPDCSRDSHMRRMVGSVRVVYLCELVVVDLAVSHAAPLAQDLVWSRILRRRPLMVTAVVLD